MTLIGQENEREHWPCAPYMCVFVCVCVCVCVCVRAIEVFHHCFGGNNQ